jgi:hypothetical protein
VGNAIALYFDPFGLCCESLKSAWDNAKINEANARNILTLAQNAVTKANQALINSISSMDAAAAAVALAGAHAGVACATVATGFGLAYCGLAMAALTAASDHFSSTAQLVEQNRGTLKQAENTSRIATGTWLDALNTTGKAKKSYDSCMAKNKGTPENCPCK